jgi:hypothetical protein
MLSRCVIHLIRKRHAYHLLEAPTQTVHSLASLKHYNGCSSSLGLLGGPTGRNAEIPVGKHVPSLWCLSFDIVEQVRFQSILKECCFTAQCRASSIRSTRSGGWIPRAGTGYSSDSAWYAHIEPCVFIFFYISSVFENWKFMLVAQTSNSVLSCFHHGCTFYSKFCPHLFRLVFQRNNSVGWRDRQP